MRFGYRTISCVILLSLAIGCSHVDEMKDRIIEIFGIEVERSLTTRKMSWHDYEDKLRGAWAGKMIGVSYGAPYEFRFNGKMQDEPIRSWKPEYVNNSLNQDDLYVQMTFLEAIERKGLGVTGAEAGAIFANSKYDLWHANREARLNLWAGIQPPQSGHPRFNPHADDIDFQIESDLFGILTPGMPQTAARMAERFGHVMNYGDGVYGGVFIATMYSAAFFKRDRMAVVESGLKCIPKESEYAQLIRDVVAYYKANPADWKGCWVMLENKWAKSDLCPDGRNQPFNIDAKLNGGYVVMGLLYGEGDFERTLLVATLCGQDSDCNPSTAAGILGCMIGYGQIPQTYRLGIPLIGDKYFAYTQYSFDTLIPACRHITQELVMRFGGSTEQLGDREYVNVPVQDFKNVLALEQFSDDLYTELSPAYASLPQMRMDRLQQKLQSQLNGWNSGWTIQNCALEMNPGLHEAYADQKNVFVTHPLNETTPCSFTWHGRLSANPSLQLLVASSDYSDDADWQLRVRVNGQIVLDRQVGRQDGKVFWDPITIDLVNYANQDVTLTVENASNGGTHEAGYWANIKLN